MTELDVYDPKGLMREAFVIEGITVAECRSIFLDWALGVPAMRDTRQEVSRLIARYSATAPDDHPMLATLRAALADSPTPKRRGGRSARLT